MAAQNSVIGASGDRAERQQDGMSRASFRSFLRSHRRVALPLAFCLLIIAVAAFGSLLAPSNPDASVASPMLAPNLSHLMGTDEFGRDVLSRMLSGAKVSLVVGVGSVLIGLIFGGLIGIAAGLRSNGPIDAVLMRLMDMVLSVPVLVLAAVIAGLTGGTGFQLGPLHVSELFSLTLIIALGLVPIFARIARGSAMAEAGEEYIVAARACGVHGWRLAAQEILPNVISPLIVQAALTVGVAIIAESALSFLGLGIQTPQPSWGNILADGQQELLLGGWWLVVFPTIAIAVTAFAFLMLGDRLRDELDPRRSAQLPKGEEVLR
jgi:peptide/nickel transport system permease protein